MSRKQKQKARRDEPVPQGPIEPGSPLHEALRRVARAVAEKLTASWQATMTTRKRTEQRSPGRPTDGL